MPLVQWWAITFEKYYMGQIQWENSEKISVLPHTLT